MTRFPDAAYSRLLTKVGYTARFALKLPVGNRPNLSQSSVASVRSRSVCSRRKPSFKPPAGNDGFVPVPAISYRYSKSWSGSSHKRAFDDLAALPDRIEVVAPPLRHADTFLPVLAAVINTANGITVTVRQAAFNRVRIP